MTAPTTHAAARVRVEPVELLDGVGAWFTGPPGGDAPRGAVGGGPDVGVAGNLSHRRPHQPSWLAADRQAAADQMDLDPGDLHLMQQVHGREVGVVDAGTTQGAELRGVDALVTTEPGRALVVLVADCVPVLLAAPGGAVAALHAGRRGVECGIVAATLAVLGDLGARAERIVAAIGPAIGGCCYEVPAAMQADLVAAHPAAEARTTWGTPSLDLPAAVEALLHAAGVPRVERSGGCTRCEPGWFSHRRDPATGRQAGVVVRRGAA